MNYHMQPSQDVASGYLLGQQIGALVRQRRINRMLREQSETTWAGQRPDGAFIKDW